MRFRNPYTLFRRKGTKVWYYYTYVGRRRVSYSTGKTTKAEANRFCMDLYKEGRLKPGADETDVLFADFVKDLWVWGKCPIIKDRLARKRHITKSTAYSYRTHLELHLVPFFGKMRVCDITPADVNSFVLGMVGKGLSGTTTNVSLAVMRMTMDYAVSRGKAEKNPCAGVLRAGARQKVRDAFSSDEVKRIFAEDKDNIYYWMCALSACTGMRLGEVIALRHEDVAGGVVAVRHSFSVHDGMKAPKNGKERKCPVPRDVEERILSFTPSGFVFSLDGGKTPVTKSSPERWLRIRLKALGIEGKSFHSFRHFFNTVLVGSGVSGEVTRAVVGHSSEDMTEHYLHLDKDSLGAVRKAQEEIEGAFGE